MAKKIVKMKGHGEGDHEAYTLNFKHVLLFLLMTFLAAFGLASVVQGLMLQWSYGFKYGLFSYLLAFVFIGVAKHLKWKLYGHMHQCCK